MDICNTIDDLRRRVRLARSTGRTIGLVPTMGALHAGHASLVDASVAEGHFTVVTIFVNPTQFGPTEDLAKYPRTLEADLELCHAHGAGAVFAPSVEEMYPEPGRTVVHVSGLTEGLCGADRPGHFDGVCTVVAKLFHIAMPDAAYFGQKDAQQAAVIRRMVRDLDFPLEVRVCPIVREGDGLALSSRNRYLSAQERAQAPALHEALQTAAARARGGVRSAEQLAGAIRDTLAERAPLGELDYVAVVAPDTLEPVEAVAAPVLLAVAVRFASARLIDNLRVDPDAPVS